jgi:AcrR family transcriptional regulator
MRDTATRLTAVTRRLTAERGLAGFTIEELCDEVDVSRRTFFNYFASKEDAIFGADPAEELRQVVEGFRARPAGWHRVLDDLVELVIAHAPLVDHDAVAHVAFMAALEREPQLLQRIMGTTRDRERQAIAMVAEREGVEIDDPRAEAAVGILFALLKATGERFLAPENTRDFSDILTSSLAVFRTVLAPNHE